MNTHEFTEEDKYKYYQLLFQSDISNLISNKDIDDKTFYDMINGVGDAKLKNGEYMDLYLCEKLFSTLLPGMESLSKSVEKLMDYSKFQDQRELDRFNPCNFLAEYLIRNNPKYGKNQDTDLKFKKFTRKERKSRMIKDKEKMNLKVINFYKKENMILSKLNIEEFVTNLSMKLNLDNKLNEFKWVEYFRVKKDDQEITLDEFLKAFEKCVLEIYNITEDMLNILLN